VACTTLVLGGVRSGKSRFAVDTHAACARVTFVATAVAGDADMRDRIEHHRRDRPPRWLTVEEPCELVPRVREACAASDAVLVDCLGVWVANLMLRGDADDQIVKHADELAALLRLRLTDVTLVSNEVGLGVHPVSEAGRQFRDLLGRVNQHVAAAADRVVLMVAGQPLVVKDARA